MNNFPQWVGIKRIINPTLSPQLAGKEHGNPMNNPRSRLEIDIAARRTTPQPAGKILTAFVRTSPDG